MRQVPRWGYFVSASSFAEVISRAPLLRHVAFRLFPAPPPATSFSQILLVQYLIPKSSQPGQALIMPIPLDDDDGEAAFKDLPRFDARDFEPPAWANGPHFQWGKNGESSNLSSGGRRPFRSEENGDAHPEEEEEETWEDASEGRSVIDPELATFTTAELRVSFCFARSA